jgi:hypothetical protein
MRPYAIRRFFNVLHEICAGPEINPFLGAEFQTQVSLDIASICKIGRKY